MCMELSEFSPDPRFGREELMQQQMAAFIIYGFLPLFMRLVNVQVVSGVEFKIFVVIFLIVQKDAIISLPLVVILESLNN